MKKLLMLIMWMFFFSGAAFTQTTGDYRTVSSGDWNSNSVWERYNGTIWVGADNFPVASNSGNISIRSGHNVTCNIGDQIDQLTILAAGTLTIVNIGLNLTNGPGIDLSIYGTVNWTDGYTGGCTTWEIYSGGLIKVEGGLGTACNTWNVKSGGTIDFLKGNFYLNSCAITNEGIINFNSDFPNIIRSNFAAVPGGINNTSSGVVNFLKNFEFGKDVEPYLFFNNNGTVNIGTGVVAYFTLASGGFTNKGTINFQGTASTPNTSVLQLLSNTRFNIQGGSFTGFGNLQLANGTINAEIDFIIPNGILLSTSGGINNTITGIGKLTITGKIRSGLFERISITNPGTPNELIIASSGEMTLGEIQINNGKIINNGTVIMGTTVEAVVNIESPGIFENNGIIKTGEAGFEARIRSFGAAGTFNNNGIIETGIKPFDAGSNNNSVTFNNNTTGKLTGQGNINLPTFFNNNGTIAPGAGIGITFITNNNSGNLFSALSTLEIDIKDNSGAGTGHDQLTRNQDLVLNGTLKVNELGDVPTGSYTIINLLAGTITGNFSSFNLPVGYTVTKTGNTIILNVDDDVDNDGVINRRDCAPLNALIWRTGNFFIDKDHDGYDAGKQDVCYGNSVPAGFKSTTLGTDCDDTKADITACNICSSSITITGPTSFCAGGNATLTASAGNSYLWSNGATTRSISSSTGGSYTVTVINEFNCSATSAPVTIIVNPLPAVTLAPFSEVCNTLPAFSLSGGSPSGGVYSGAGISNGRFDPAAAGAGTHVITYTFTNNNGCTNTAQQNITITNCGGCVAGITVSSPTSFCTGSSVTLTASTGSSYQWSTGATTRSITVNSSGSYSVTVTNTDNCSATSAATIVTVNPLPATPVISAGGPVIFCSGGSVVLTAPASASYLWSNGATTRSITVNSGGSYSVTVTNTTNCSATSAATLVTVNPLPATPLISAGGPVNFCSGGSVVLTAPASASYLWSNGTTTRSITVNSSGNYTVTVTTDAGCSNTSAPLAVTVNPIPSVTLAALNAVCNTLPAFSLTGGQPNGGIYSGPGVSSGQFDPAIAGVGTHTISYTYTSVNGCVNTAQRNITLTNCSTCSAIITAGGATSFCTGGTIVLTANAGSSYLWSNGAITQSISVTSSGSYSVTVTNADNCRATSPAILVKVNAEPATPVITGSLTICPGRNTVLTSSAATAYLWNTGATTQSINVNTAGDYSVRVSNTERCSTTSGIVKVTSGICNSSYCSIRGNSSTKGYIKNVFVCHGFNNSTGWNGYSDYTSKSITTAQGRMLGFTVTPGYAGCNAYTPVYIRAWIDWNGDGDFDDAGECVFAPSQTTTVKSKFWVRVPASTTSGNKRIRILLSNDKINSACGTFAYGEAEDYTIKIGAARLAAPDATDDDFDEAGNEFSVYPNPVSDRMIIERSGYDENKANASPALMMLSTTAGKIILQTKLISLTQAVDVRNVASGIYFVTILQNGRKTTSRILIMH